MNKLKLILLLVLTINTTKVLALDVNAQPRHGLRSANWCRIRLSERSNDCDGASCNSYSLNGSFGLSGSEVNDFNPALDRFGDLRQSDIDGLNRLYRGLAIKSLLKRNCIDHGTILSIPQGCAYANSFGPSDFDGEVGCRRLQRPGGNNLLDRYFNYTSILDTDINQEIEEIGEFIDIQRSIKFELERFENRSNQNDTEFRLDHLAILLGITKDELSYFCTFTRDRGSYCNLRYFYETHIEGKQDQEVGENFDEFIDFLKEKFQKRERRINNFLFQDPRFLVGAAPEAHVYPVFESLRRRVLGKERYDNYLERGVRNQTSVFEYPQFLRSETQGSRSARGRKIRRDAINEQKQIFLEHQIIYSQENSRGSEPVVQPLSEQDLDKISQISISNNQGTLNKICNKEITLNQLMHAPGLEIQVKEFLPQGQDENLACIKQKLMQDSLDQYNPLGCLAIGLAGVAGVILTPATLGISAIAITGAIGAADLLCSYHTGAIRQYIDTQETKRMCRASQNFFGGQGSSNQEETCSDSQLANVRNSLEGLTTEAIFEGTTFAVPAAVTALNTMRSAFRLSRSSVQRLRKSLIRKRRSRNARAVPDNFAEDAIESLKEVQPELRFFTNDEIKDVLVRACRAR